MVESFEAETEDLLRRAAQGDRGAVEGLMSRHRERLRLMVAVRMDTRLAARVDPDGSRTIQSAGTRINSPQPPH